MTSTTTRNRARNLRGAFAALAAAAIWAAPAAAEGSAIYRSEASVDWEKRILTVRIVLDLAAAGLRLPAGRLEAERMIDRDLPSLAKEALFGLPVDSFRNVEQTVEDGTIDVNALLALPRNARRAEAAFSKDLTGFHASYEFRLSAVASLYVRGEAASARVEAPLEWRASRPYTGVIVYAKGSLPVRGEGTEGRAEPCLFPRIYDDTMRLLLDKGLVDPEILRGEGPVGYASSLGIEATERVGTDPLRVMALQLFGDDRTDYVISRDDALRVLALAENRELIARGRFLIVIDDIERKEID